MKNFTTKRKMKALFENGRVLVAAMLFIALSAFIAKDLAAQTACCPEFYLKDAVEICPPEGACLEDGATQIGLAACKETAHVYTVYPYNAAYSYTWTVNGGTLANTTNNEAVIVWGTGSVGYIKVVIGGLCVDSITAQICLIDGPEAGLMADQYTVCTNTPVQFTNLSLGGSTYVWDFGDGNTFTSTTSSIVSHPYTNSGTYKVKLTATDMGLGHPGFVFVNEEDSIPILIPCGCSDTATITIVVLPGEGPKITTDCCYGTVCPGETSSFCTPAGCSSYLWTVTGGGVISSGAGTNCIVVTWPLAYSGPTTVSLTTPGCSTSPCAGTTTIQVPVLYPSLPIVGPTTLCQGTSGSFSLPVLPGTYYTWTVSGGSHQFNQNDMNVASVNITFFQATTYTVQCVYDNPLAGCGGTSIWNVEVLPVFSIFYGEETVCEGSTMPYLANGNANWTAPGATIIGSQPASSVSIYWPNPGTYTITATPIPLTSWCNASAIKVVEVVALPVLGAIKGDIEICPNKNYTYKISSDNDDGPFKWTITPSGQGTILSEMGENNDSIVAKFTGTGSWKLNVEQALVIAPGDTCWSLTKTIDIDPFPAPTISGNTPVCVDAVETYIAGAANPKIDFQWLISPSSQGTILSGQGSNTVTIKWHGPAPLPNATLTVTTCTGSNSKTITINDPPKAVITHDYSTVPVFCEGDPAILTFTASTGGGYSYQWWEGNTLLPGEISSTLLISISSLTTPPGIYQYYVIVTKNGCTVKSNIIDVVIKDCSSGNPGGCPNPGPGCDVKAYFWSYVECDKVTLIDYSYPSWNVFSHLWSVTGPGTGTFSPNASFPNPTLTVSASGIYNIMLVVTSNSGCKDTIIETVNISLPEANIASSSPACEGSPVYFSTTPINPGCFYEWKFGDTYTSYEANTEHAYKNSGTYTVILNVKNDKGCPASDTTVITVHPRPSCTITGFDTICPGYFEKLTAVCPGMGYQWYKDGKPIIGATNQTFDVYKHGEYKVEVTNSHGCSSKSNEIYMYMHPLPKAKIVSDKRHECALPGDVVVFTLSTKPGNYNYEWSSNPLLAANFSPPGSASTTATLTAPLLLPAEYQFIVKVTDKITGCVNRDTLCVYIYEKPQFSLPFLDMCEGDPPVTLIPNPNDPLNYTYQWSNGATTPTIVASTPGHYSLTITNKKSGCSATEDAGFIHEKPDLSLFPTGCASICDTATLQLYIPLPLNSAQWPFNTYAGAYPAIDWYDYGSWFASGQNFVFPASGSGNHEFSVVVQNIFGCVDTAGVFCLKDDSLCCEIIVDYLMTIPATCPTSADGTISIGLNPASTVAPFTITLFYPNGNMATATIPTSGPWGPSWGDSFSNLVPGVYVVVITDASGACSMVFDIVVDYLQEYCCFAELDPGFIHITAPITYTTDMVWDNKYFIDYGIMVTVDGAVLDITNVDVVFEECAGIEFINGGYLRANNSVFRPCDIDKSWKGLRFDAPGEFDNIVNESTFKNAEAALYFKGGSDGVVSNGLFSNCNFGIRVDSNNYFNHPISGNRFVTDDFWPDFACDSAYSFVSKFATYGVYSDHSRFLDQVSHNEFINAKGTSNPSTYGIYQWAGGGVFSENTFTDLGMSVYLNSQLYYTSVENNEIEVNLQPLGNFSSIDVIACQGPVIEIVNNEITNNFSQHLSFSAIYAWFTTNLSIFGNQIDGFNFGIIDLYPVKHQVSNNQITNSQTFGIYVAEQPGSKGYITCNTIKMRSFNYSIGLAAFNMSASSEVSSNCISDCYTSMSFSGRSILPLIRNNFLYNYKYVGINVQGSTGNIGTVASPGLNTLWSNNNLATDINSNTNITVADNFGMFNISYPWVQITSNNPYHSTASCAQQIFNMPSQGNLNFNYTCDNFSRLLSPLTGAGGSFNLSEDYRDSFKTSPNQFETAGMILASLDNPGIDLLNEIISIADISENQESLLKYNFYYRNADYMSAQMNLEMFAPATTEEQDFKAVTLYDLEMMMNGSEVLTGQDIESLEMIAAQKSAYSNLAITLLNNVSGHIDHLAEAPPAMDVLRTDNIRRIETDGSYLNIYPNPVKNTAYIEFVNNTEGNSKIEVFDITGKLVTNIPVSIVAGGIELDVQQLSGGIYFVTITNSETGFIQKGKMVKIEN